jgi:hypothetical protein
VAKRPPFEGSRFARNFGSAAHVARLAAGITDRLWSLEDHRSLRCCRTCSEVARA